MKYADHPCFHAGLLLFLTLLAPARTSALPQAYLPDIDGLVFIVDTSLDLTVDFVDLGRLSGPGGVGVYPDGSRVLVKKFNLDTLAVIDTTDNSVVTNVTVGYGPSDISVLPDGSQAYVTLYDLDLVAILDTSNNTLITTIPAGDGPFGIDSSPDSSRVYIANRYSNTVTVIDTVTHSVVTDIPIGDGDGGVAVHPDGSRLYVTSFNTNEFSVIDTATNTVIEVIPSKGAFGVAITPDGNHLYVTNFSANTVEVFDTRDNTLVKTIGVGKSPYGLDITPDGLYAYVTNYFEPTVSVINTTNRIVETTIQMPRRVFAFSSFIGPQALGGSISGFDPGNFAACYNFETLQIAGLTLPRGHANWSCTTLGVEFEPRDRIMMLEWATVAQSPTLVGGTVSGVKPNSVTVRCRNLSTGQTVQTLAGPGRLSWDCLEMGLDVTTGDRIMMLQFGTVE